jgi:hypothetical protein
LKKRKSTSFNDPNHYNDNGDLPYNMDKDEDDYILEAKIDPEEWRKELDRVYIDLDNIEKEIELNRQRGTRGGGLIEEVEECRRHIELIVDLCKDIKNTCHHDVRKVFGKVAEKLEEDLEFIRKHEIRINNNNAEAIARLN